MEQREEVNGRKGKKIRDNKLRQQRVVNSGYDETGRKKRKGDD